MTGCGREFETSNKTPLLSLKVIGKHVLEEEWFDKSEWPDSEHDYVGYHKILDSKLRFHAVSLKERILNCCRNYVIELNQLKFKTLLFPAYSPDVFSPMLCLIC